MFMRKDCHSESRSENTATNNAIHNLYSIKKGNPNVYITVTVD
jgi:hypothetical protein